MFWVFFFLCTGLHWVMYGLHPPFQDPLCASRPIRKKDEYRTGLRMTVCQSWTGHPGLSEERRHWDKMSLKGPPWQWRRYTVLSGTMTVLTVFRSVSELHKLEQGRAEGVGAKATVHWTNIITTKGTKECMKRAALNDDGQQGNHVLPLHFAAKHATQRNLY